MIRLHGMGERPGILAELGGAQGAHVGDALHRGRALVHREFLVAIDRQPFLQRQLEPVAAGHPVAGPVVEILVGDDGFDALVVGIGGRLGARQHVFGVEDVQPLVLHRPHVEIRHGGDVEHVEVVFQAEHLLVPRHRGLERAHGVIAAVLVALADPDRQRDLAARFRDETIVQGDQIAGDQGEQVAGLGMRVGPDDAVAPVGQGLGRAGIAVRQHDRAGGGIGGEGDGEAGHHVGAVGEPGDAAEALGLALGEEGAVREVEAGELGVGCGVDDGLDLEHAGLGRFVDHQGVALQPPAVGAEGRAVERDRADGLAGAVEPQGGGGVGVLVAAQREAGAHHGGVRVEVEREVHRVDQPGGRAVVTEAGFARRGDGGGVVGVWHGASLGADGVGIARGVGCGRTG